MEKRAKIEKKRAMKNTKEWPKGSGAIIRKQSSSFISILKL